MHADFVQLMDDYADTQNVLIASADCSTYSRQPGTGAELCNHYSLTGYPYLVYGDPNNVRQYGGSRDHASMLAWAQQYVGPVDPTPSPVPTPLPPAPSPVPSPVPTPQPSSTCPSDSDLVNDHECLWQNGAHGLQIPAVAMAYCNYLADNGVFGYYWDSSAGDYECAQTARKTTSGSTTYCLWQNGELGVSIPSGSVADCDSFSQGRIGFIMPGMILV